MIQDPLDYGAWTDSMNSLWEWKHWLLWCTMIQDPLDYGAWTDSMNSLWEWKHWLLWCTIIQDLLDHGATIQQTLCIIGNSGIVFLWCTMTQDHSDLGISTAPSNPSPEWIHWCIWCTRTQMIFGHKARSRSSQKNTPLHWLTVNWSYNNYGNHV